MIKQLFQRLVTKWKKMIERSTCRKQKAEREENEVETISEKCHDSTITVTREIRREVTFSEEVEIFEYYEDEHRWRASHWSSKYPKIFELSLANHKHPRFNYGSSCAS